MAKTRAWEQDHGQSFVYDGVPLLAMLDEYVMLRHEREEAKRRMRVHLLFNYLLIVAVIHFLVERDQALLNGFHY